MNEERDFRDGRQSREGSDVHVGKRASFNQEARSPRSRPPISYFFLLPFYFFLSLYADHPLCAAVFCSARLCGCDFTFACFALPRRHCSPASPTLGCQAKCLDDQSLGRFLSLLHV